MNFRIIKTVIAREYLTRVKKKSFIVTTMLYLYCTDCIGSLCTGFNRKSFKHTADEAHRKAVSGTYRIYNMFYAIPRNIYLCGALYILYLYK